MSEWAPLARHQGDAATLFAAQPLKYTAPMSDATQRSILRWIHLVFSVPIIGYIYSPFAALPDYAPVTRFVAVPVIALSGVWMWKGHVLRRLVSKKSA